MVKSEFNNEFHDPINSIKTDLSQKEKTMKSSSLSLDINVNNNLKINKQPSQIITSIQIPIQSQQSEIQSIGSSQLTSKPRTRSVKKSIEKSDPSPITSSDCKLVEKE